MREILFRGKRKDNGEWVKGDFCSPCNIVFLENGYDAALGKNDCPICNDLEVILETVGQYTGLTDKHGNKFFEGDICKHRSYYSGNIVISVVTYTDGQFLAMPDKNSGFNLSDELEVIGNIHDNPELLEGGVEND